MADKLQVDIVTPDQKVYSNEATAVRLPGQDGYFGVLRGHVPLVAALKVGNVKVVNNGSTSYFSTSGGFVEVLSNKVSILAETAEAATSVDVKRAGASKERAEKRVSEGHKSWDIDRARVALAKAINRVKVAANS